MKTKFFSLQSVFFILIIFGLVACKGEIGPPGADGIDGIDGIDGVDGVDGENGNDGVDGEDGEDGEDGNANIISSDWFVPAWEADVLYSVNNQSATIDIPELTQEVFDSGVVLAYWKNNAGHVWPLPTKLMSSDYWFAFLVHVGDIYLYYYNSTVTNPPVPHESNEFRYVIIPPASSKSTNSNELILKELKDAGVDINNYYEVMDYYGLDY